MTRSSTQVAVKARSEPFVREGPAPLKRRGVLLGVGVAGVAGVAAGLASRALQAPAPEPVAQATAGETAEGYRLSAHVRSYYETARV